jgi:hypothetical protein
MTMKEAFYGLKYIFVPSQRVCRRKFKAEIVKNGNKVASPSEPWVLIRKEMLREE